LSNFLFIKLLHIRLGLLQKTKTCHLLTLTLIVNLIPNFLCAQTKKTFTLRDSVLIQRNTYVIKKDTIYYVDKDTIIFHPQKGKDHSDFYKNLKEKLYKKKLTRKLYDVAFKTKPNPSFSHIATSGIIIPNNPYFQYRGKVIGNIRVKKLQVFGEVINDTTKKANSWFQKTGNKLHLNTRDRVIYNNLTFKSGEKVNPFKISDSERLIRRLGFIKDTRIIFKERSEESDTVDVVIITQDRWSLTGDISPYGLEAGAGTIIEQNVLGLGHQTRHRFIYDTRLPQPFGYEGHYIVPFIRNTFINADLNYARTYFRDAFVLRIGRPFLTPDIKYAFGIETGQQRLLSHQILLTSDTLREDVFDFKFNRQDVWIGRSFKIKDGSFNRNRLIVSARAIRNIYIDRPLVDYHTNRIFHHRNLFLSSLGFSQRAYDKSKLIYAFGVTEDIPYGQLFELTAGYEVAEFYKRWYGGISLSKGVLNPLGYIFGSLNFGGFVRNNTFEQGILRAETNYISNLFWINNIYLRQFIRIHYTNGIRRFSNELIDINNHNGVRGFFSHPIRGSQRLALNLETVVFSKRNFIDFNFAYFIFADVGRLGLNWGKFLDGTSYQGYGIGLRVRNENLAFQTFQIRLAYYPVISPGMGSFGFDFSGLPHLRLNDYDIKAPNTIPFY
jgi:hypothetical protein